MLEAAGNFEIHPDTVLPWHATLFGCDGRRWDIAEDGTACSNKGHQTTQRKLFSDGARFAELTIPHGPDELVSIALPE